MSSEETSTPIWTTAMKITKNQFAFPILMEKLPLRTPDDKDVATLSADIAVGSLAFDCEKRTITAYEEATLAETNADEESPKLMADGLVAYSTDAHGHPALYVRREGKCARAIAPELEVTSHIVSPDGKTLVFSDKNGWVRQWDDEDGLTKPIFKVSGKSQLLGFDQEGDSLLVSTETRSHFNVHSYELADNAWSLLFQDHNKPDVMKYSAAMAPGGRSFSVLRDHYLTKVCLESGDLKGAVLRHSPSSNHQWAPRILTALDDRFLVLGGERSMELNDMEEDRRDSEDLDLLEVECNDDGEYYDKEWWPLSIPVMGFTVFDTETNKSCYTDWMHRVGSLQVIGGDFPEEGTFNSEFPETTPEHKAWLQRADELQTVPRRELSRLPQWD